MAEDKKQDNFQRQFITIVGIAFAVILILGVALYFIGDDIKRNTERVKDARKELSARSKAMKSLTLLRRQSEQARSYSADLAGIMINRDQLINLARDVNAIARQNQIDLNFSFSGESSVTNEGLGKIGLAITGSGSFNDFIQFLKVLNNSRYFIKINTLDFVRAGDKLKATFSGNAFFFELNK